MFDEIIYYIKHLYNTDGFIPLHEPRFNGNEKLYVNECIDSTFVSSVGTFVTRFESMIAEYTGASKAIACVNGTEALHLALKLAGVKPGDEVLTQALSFIATANAITYTGAFPVFLDVDQTTMGLSPNSLDAFLQEFGDLRNDGYCYNLKTGNRIMACLPMHTFGHPVQIEEIMRICEQYNMVLIEDAAESIGSRYKEKHTGTFARLGILSFNGNKIITTGGGGMILTDDIELAARAKHLTTQAKVPHPWEFNHDQIGYNLRMPNINAALGVAQMEQLDNFLFKKRELANQYKIFFETIGIRFFSEPSNGLSNYWLNAILLDNRRQRDEFLDYTNKKGVMTRPVWTLMPKLPMYVNCQRTDISQSEWFEDHVVNIPSSVIL